MKSGKKNSCLYKSDRGFTLMEVLVVVSIIAILSTLGLLNWKTVIDRSKRSAVLDEVREYGLASGIARGDTGIFWRLQDLQSASMPTTDVYYRPINDSNASFTYFADTSLWKGPYLSLQRVAGTDQKRKFDDQGNPIDLYGNWYLVTLLRIQDSSTTLMNSISEPPANRPDFTLIISWGPDGWPGKRDSGLPYDQKTSLYWLFYEEQDSDDIYYVF